MLTELFLTLYACALTAWTATLIGMPLLIGIGLVARIVRRHHV